LSRDEARQCIGQCLPMYPPFRSFVANGHQAVHHVSSSLSEIPYGGFSPVRLQTGRQRQPSPLRAYMPTKLLQLSHAIAPWGNRRTVSALRREPSKRTGPEALGSASGYSVPSRHCLLWPHPSFWRRSDRLMVFADRSLPYGRGPEGP
jgi:hypothetical protein